MKNLLTLAILLSGLLIALPATANAGTLYVDDNGHCGGNTPCYIHIQNAIDAATAGDTVYVYKGTYNENITLKSGVIVQGEGAEVTTIQGTGSDAAVRADHVDSNAKIDGFTITGGGSHFGGIYCEYSSPTITNNIISNNTATDGGGIYCFESSPNITNNIIINNISYWTAGGILCQNHSSPNIANNIISNNNGGWFGGGGIMCISHSSPNITNNTIINNKNTGYYCTGAGVCCYSDSSPTITNNIISNNTGSGIACYFNSLPTIANNDVYKDEWGNSEFQYLNCTAGQYNISTDPMFVSDFVSDGDYHLQEGSPCIDVGTNDAPALPATDFDGNPRKVDGDGDEVAVVDMGAFEYILLWIEVEIDIKPGSYPNSINPKSHGLITVAILSTNVFDAALVDPLSVKFGPSMATEAHGMGHFEDVNRDGKLDLVLHFYTQETGIKCGDSNASITGTTFNGIQIEGSDSIKTVSCK